jgi:L-seryl-tRNA(Ser) seleniumtransferase
LANGRDVVVSRGELVQIGGGFRIPDILKSAGANLIEVGTTNITTVADYADAVTENTALVLTVHRANFTMSGFVESPCIADLRAALGPEILIVSDLGSGNLVREIAGQKVTEPTPGDALRQGANLVCFSCDKMLGATQGGVIAGKADLVRRVKRHPIMRVVRPDKLTFAALQTVLSHHLLGDRQHIPLWRMAAEDAASLELRVKKFIDENKLDKTMFELVACESTFGGGTTPEEKIPSFGLRILKMRADEIATTFQQLEPPVLGRIVDDRFQIDFRTLLDNDEEFLAAACLKLMPGRGAAGEPRQPQN